MNKRAMNIKAAVIFLFPSLCGFMIFYILPFIQVIKYSFITDTFSGKFAGISNYVNIMHSTSFIKAAVNTLNFTAVSVPLLIVFSLAAAMMLNGNAYFSNIFRMLFMIPITIPVASVVMVWQMMVDERGFMNRIIAALGYIPIDWMNSKAAIVVVILMFLWKNTGYNMILFIAALQNIPKEYYEYASIEGAGSVSKFKNITIVYILPTLFFVFIISIINSFKVFREVYLIAGSYPGDSIYMLQHYMNNMFMSLDYQKLSAAAVLMALAIVIMLTVMFEVKSLLSGNSRRRRRI